MVNPVIEGWSGHFCAWDTIIVHPNKELNARTFFPPLPKGLSVNRLRFGIEDSIKRTDMGLIIEAVGLRGRSDGYDLCSGPLHIFGTCGLGIGSSQRPSLPLWPEVRPKEEFYLELQSRPLALSQPIGIALFIDGTIASEGERGRTAGPYG